MEENVDLIANQWKDFSNTEAYKALISYIDFQSNIATDMAKGTFSNGDTVDFSQLFPYLQRSVAYDVLLEYINGFVDYKKS